MGNSSSKDSQGRTRAASSGERHSSAAASLAGSSSIHDARAAAILELYGSRSGRGSRQELPIFFSRSRGGADRDVTTVQREDRPRETKPERELKKAERERQARLAERERSVKEESVDGGFLVTLGTYTGPEDFNKVVVRQLQIERRLAPFWKGLNDHSESWAEHQLVAAVRGLPVPAADEIPPEMARTASQASSVQVAVDSQVKAVTIPMSSRSQSYESSTSANLSGSHPAFSAPSHTGGASTAQLLRGRAKTLASLATGSKSHSPDLSPREIQLPRDPYVNGTPIEAVLYKDAMECPICFMYYPPYLNKTRCCDQPICSECFVQIKRPDPHPPEHEQPGQERPPEEEADLLVSEVAACPFCVTPEFGVTYEPPPFRRGLTHAHNSPLSALRHPTSATSSSSSLTPSATGRRRATSLSATSPHVITTDRVRPDWAKKLADARAHVLRRSAAATALHNAAYVLGNQSDPQLRAALPAFGRRRRTIVIETPNGSGVATPQRDDDGSADLYPDRGSSRRLRSRVDDLEDLMMMEAIRLSLAAEEERKRKMEKEAAKELKKKEKEAKKEAKHNKSRSGSLYAVTTHDSGSTDNSTRMARSTSNLGSSTASLSERPIPVPVQGKGKAPAQDLAGFNPLLEQTSTFNTEPKETIDPSDAPSVVVGSPSKLDPQRHLEESRANLLPTAAVPIPIPSTDRVPQHTRHLSYASSANSSLLNSAQGSLRGEAGVIPGSGDILSTPEQSGQITPHDITPAEPMLNFSSLAAMVGAEELVPLVETPAGNSSTSQAVTTAEKQPAAPTAPLPSATAGPLSAQSKEISAGADTAIVPIVITPEPHSTDSDTSRDGERDSMSIGKSSPVTDSPSPILEQQQQPPDATSQKHSPSVTKDLGTVDLLERGHEEVQ